MTYEAIFRGQTWFAQQVSAAFPSQPKVEGGATLEILAANRNKEKMCFVGGSKEGEQCKMKQNKSEP